MGDVPLSKECSKCRRVLLLSEFYRRASSCDGHEGVCKECRNKVRRAAWRRRKDQPHGPRERARLWREANPGLKQCSGCGEIKPVSEFYRSSKNKDGLKCRCKACRTEDAKDYMPAYLRAYYKAHREQIKASANRYYKEHGEEIRERVREYQRADPEANRRRAVQWQKDNRERHNEHCRVRRHKKRSNGGSFTVDQWLDLCAAYDFRCACCGVLEQTVDHVIPVTKGGSSFIENIQPLCKSCNSSKGTKGTDYRAVRGSILSGASYASRTF